MNKRIVDLLYTGFRPYVSKTKLYEYDKEYSSDSRNSITFVKDFFPRYVNISHYHKNPKQPNDALLFNYFVIDLEVQGLKRTSTLKEFIRSNR